MPSCEQTHWLLIHDVPAPQYDVQQASRSMPVVLQVAPAHSASLFSGAVGWWAVFLFPLVHKHWTKKSGSREILAKNGNAPVHFDENIRQKKIKPQGLPGAFLFFCGWSRMHPKSVRFFSCAVRLDSEARRLREAQLRAKTSAPAASFLQAALPHGA